MDIESTSTHWSVVLLPGFFREVSPFNTHPNGMFCQEELEQGELQAKALRALADADELKTQASRSESVLCLVGSRLGGFGEKDIRMDASS